MDRRRFLRLFALAFMKMPSSPPHPILDPIEEVMERFTRVRLREDRIQEVASWMAYESLPWPDFRSPLIPEGNDADTMDFIFLTASINFAFTDFEEHVVFRTSYAGREWSDSDAMMACLKGAYEEGTPILTGRYLRGLTRSDLERLFSGNVEMPMLEERLAIFHEVGGVLDESYGGRFHRFAAAGPRKVTPLLERLISTFPSFRDESGYRGTTLRFDKRAQLLLWQLHARFRESGFFALEDPERLTIFADYIVPVALRLLGITSYVPDLERRIQARELLPRGSEEEVEIRATSIQACHLLTRAIKEKRPYDRQVVDPVIDGRLWTHYHETHWPHHLTVTTSY